MFHFPNAYSDNIFKAKKLYIDYCRTGFSMGDLGVQVSVRLSIHPFVRLFVCLSTFTLGVLWAQLFLQMLKKKRQNEQTKVELVWHPIYWSTSLGLTTFIRTKLYMKILPEVLFWWTICVSCDFYCCSYLLIDFCVSCYPYCYFCL